MKRGDEGESHKVGNGRKSGMDKITIMKKEKGVEEEKRCPRLPARLGERKRVGAHSRSHL